MLIGSHVSYKSDTGLVGSIKEALSYGSTAFMFYTGAPQNTLRSPIDLDNVKEFNKIREENNMDIASVICHAPYIINLANGVEEDKYKFACNFLKSEIKRCETLGVKKLVLHPGSSLKLDRDDAINYIADGINYALEGSSDVTILLETMAGKGSEVGVNLEEIKSIIDKVSYPDKIGVCLDTCHLNDSGIDINNFEEYLDLFDKIIGIDKIGCVHVNDSKNPLSSHKDRHENIGFGTIGFDALIGVLYSNRLSDVPKILETPYVEKMYPPYKVEIEMIKNKKFNEKLYEDVINLYK